MSAMDSDFRQPDLRLYARYAVQGSMILLTECGRFEGEPLILSFVDVLFRAKRMPPVGTLGVLHLDIQGFDETITLGARVIRTEGVYGAALFLVERRGLLKCIGQLSRRQLTFHLQ